MLVFLALGNAKELSFALGEAKIPNANDLASQWNIGFKPILYSTATKMLVSKKPHGPSATTNASQWNIFRVGYTRIGFALAMYISFCLCQFRSHWVANMNAISCGIWALYLGVPAPAFLI